MCKGRRRTACAKVQTSKLVSIIAPVRSCRYSWYEITNISVLRKYSDKIVGILPDTDLGAEDTILGYVSKLELFCAKHEAFEANYETELLGLVCVRLIIVEDNVLDHDFENCRDT